MDTRGTARSRRSADDRYRRPICQKQGGRALPVCQQRPAQMSSMGLNAKSTTRRIKRNGLLAWPLQTIHRLSDGVNRGHEPPQAPRHQSCLFPRQSWSQPVRRCRAGGPRSSTVRPRQSVHRRLRPLRPRTVPRMHVPQARSPENNVVRGLGSVFPVECSWFASHSVSTGTPTMWTA